MKNSKHKNYSALLNLILDSRITLFGDLKVKLLVLEVSDTAL